PVGNPWVADDCDAARVELGRAPPEQFWRQEFVDGSHLLRRGRAWRRDVPIERRDFYPTVEPVSAIRGAELRALHPPAPVGNDTRYELAWAGRHLRITLRLCADRPTNVSDGAARQLHDWPRPHPRAVRRAVRGQRPLLRAWGTPAASYLRPAPLRDVRDDRRARCRWQLHGYRQRRRRHAEDRESRLQYPVFPQQCRVAVGMEAGKHAVRGMGTESRRIPSRRPRSRVRGPDELVSGKRR